MKAEALPRAGDLAILAGFASFLALGGSGLAAPLLALLLVFLAARARSAAGARAAFLPFASGLLLPGMRLFYWDRADFALRSRSLLLLAGLFALAALARRRRWPQRFLRRFNGLALKRRLLWIFLASELLFAAGAALLTRGGVALAGDEPHYLAISQSLARDGDLNLFNQHFRGGFREFLDVEALPAHGTWGKGYKRIYSYHLPGLSLTLAPFFFVRLPPPLLHFLARSYLGLFGAALAALVYLFGLRLWRSRSLAFFVTLTFTLTAPVFFYSFHLFPEVQAMLLVLGALYLLLFKARSRPSAPLWAGLLLGAVLFWGVKYALFVVPLTLGFCAVWLAQRRWRSALLLALFPLLFQGLFFLYLHAAYGTFSPGAIYRGMLSREQSAAFYESLLSGIPLRLRVETLLDYFFDQRDGLLPYNPVYLLAFPGLLLALKNFRRHRLTLLLSLPAALFVLNHAFSTIRAGYCPQGRYLAPAAWALMLLAVTYYRESRGLLLRRAFLALPAYSLFVTAYQALRPFTLYQPTTHDTLVRAGGMFQEWSNRVIDLPRLLPSYIKTDNSGWLPNAAFLVLFALLTALALRRRRCGVRPRGRALASAAVFLAAFSLSSLFPRLAANAPQLVPGPRDLPCGVFFAPAAARREGTAAWLVAGGRSGRCRVRIESLLPLKSIELGLENTAREPLELEVRLFDRPAARELLAPGAGVRVRLAQPRCKRVGARCGYQLELRGRPGQAAWRLRLGLR
jgi:hypothetical protein